MKLNYDALQELYDTLMFGPVLSSLYAESPIDRAFKECDEKLSESIAFDYLKKLQDRCNNLERSNKALRDDNDKLGDKVINLNKKNEELEKERDAKSKANVALISANTDLSDRQDKLQRNFDRINHLWTRQIQENMELRSKITNLQREKKNYETIAKERAELVEDRDAWRSRAMHAEKRIEELEKSRKCYRQLHVGEGARHLWDMLQNVNDSYPDEFDGECESMEDVISMDLDDFLDAYKKWQEKKEIYRMRIWLDDFCSGRFCKGCPLESEEYKCGCGYSFRGINPIPDEDIKRYYEKARGCGQYTMKDATFCFDNKPVKMEANVEVVKDLLNAVYGIKSKEEEEHQLEYGDAVRVPWRDYDYMYIGPEGEHIRLFNPKTHTVVVVPSTENLPYQGCKIILTSEDDIRKIWKPKEK